jgi:mannan endo-1,4-beta-mannosidase
MSDLRPVFAATVFAVVVAAAAPLARADIAVTVAVDPAAGRTAISPYVYGVNQDLPGYTATARRQGGNRSTGYNWENNASNAGSDWMHSSDNFSTWVMGIPDSQAATPGIAVTTFHDQSIAAGNAYSIVTLQMAGYVAADKSGAVTTGQVAPSSRWKPSLFTKPGAFSLTPDTSDGAVYMDEFLNFLVDRYGNAATATGVRGYNLDNEPDLWAHTHARMHPTQPTCVELVTRSADLAKAVKRVDPAAETIGFVSYGFNGYYSFQDAPDWTAEKATGSYRWFVDYFLAKMKAASDTAGVRLLDVLDVHHYTEHNAGGVRVSDGTDFSNLDANKGRIQAPRALWDASFNENSWIKQWFSAFYPYLPNLKAAIATHYPGTKLAITEYNYGGESHISGGLAQADTLGIFGRDGVYLANLWLLHDSPASLYAAAAFRLYRDYDGAGGKFGDTSVGATVSSLENASAYAALHGSSGAKLHLVVLNKHYDQASAVTVQIAGATRYTRARVFAFDAAGAAITERAVISGITGNQFTTTLAALTAAHVVLEAEGSSFAAWQAGNFTAGEIANAAISGENADPDGVGVSNFQRYAFGLAARGALSAPVVSASRVDVGGQKRLAVTFARQADAPGLSYVVEGGDSLTGWTTVATIAPGTPTTVTVNDVVDITAATPRRFLRVRAVSTQ